MPDLLFPEVESPEAHPLDRLRPAFLENVIGPLAHQAVNSAIDSCGRRFAFTIAEDGKAAELRAAIGSQLRAPYDPGRHAVLAARNLYMHFSHLTNWYDMRPGWHILTERQQNAARRFTAFAFMETPDEAMFDGAATVSDTIDTIASRHPELRLNEKEKLQEFLVNPATPGILRGFATGARGFPDSIRGHNKLPQTAAWRNDPQKPIITQVGGKIHTTKELRGAAHAHRMAIQKLEVAEGVNNNGLTDLALRYSSGCPTRKLHFSIQNPWLAPYDLNLMRMQLRGLLSASAPMIEEINPNDFIIKRDAVAATCTLLAEGLDLLEK